MTYFTPDFFAFLRDLKRHNDRAWFAAHKDGFLESCREVAPLMRFLAGALGLRW